MATVEIPFSLRAEGFGFDVEGFAAAAWLPLMDDRTELRSYCIVSTLPSQEKGLH